MQSKFSVKILSLLCLISIIFIACKIPPTKKDSIIDLIKAGKTEELKERFNEDSVNTTDEDGNTLLHIAVLRNDPVIVHFLISMNADIEARNTLGKTPLLLGLNQECYEAVKVLIEYNANIFAKDDYGISPFEYAQNIGMTNIILTSKTIHQKDKRQNTALHIAAKNLKTEVVKKL